MFNKITFSNKIKAQPMGHNYNQLEYLYEQKRPVYDITLSTYHSLKM